MAALAAQSNSKSSKKKAARAIERTESPAPSTASGHADKSGDAQDDGFESAYIKELQKNIRNTNKKLVNASKTDTLLKEHAGKSLEELVDTKIINTDQKTQILKKPALQAQLAQFEEQLVQYQKVHEQYLSQAAADKLELAKSLEKAKADAVEEAEAGFKNTLHDNLLVLSQFLRLAAYRREEAKDPESDESQAIEGVLLAIYSGDESAVSSMLKLVNGTDDQVLSVPGEQLQTAYSTVKTLAQGYQAPAYVEGAPVTEAETTNEADTITVVKAEAEPSSVSITSNAPANASVADDAANASAEGQWDAANNDLSTSQEWVDVAVPRDPAETETGLEATPAAASNKQSWADDQPELVPDAAPAANEANDGFHQVQRNRGRQDREGGGGHRGDGRGRGRGEWRGRGGHRGDGRGRGRGGRGSGAPSRGPRRTEES